DQFPSLSISALARDAADANMLYAGTGKVSSFYSFGKAVGILKTTDAGTTWELTGQARFNDNPITSITASSSVILVGSENGLYRSSNAGLTFDKISNDPLPADSIDND